MSRHAPTYAEPGLELWPDEVDVPLPYPEEAVASLDVEEVDRLRIALAECLSYVETCRPAPGNRVRAWRELVPTAPQVDRTATAWDRAAEGTLRAAGKWNAEEAAAVDKAIADVAANKVRVAHRHRLPELLEFTADDVWTELGPGFPVTKGLTGRLIAARNAGLIVSTGRTVISQREGEHGHGQRLTLWKALPCE